MDTDSLISILIIIVLVCLSAFFSASETAVTSASRPRLKNMGRDGNKRAKRALRFTEQFDRTLSTILVGNNIVNILASSLCTVLFTQWFGAGGVGWATLAMTLFILLFGEITPKTIAKERAEQTVLFITPLLSFFSLILTPVSALFGLWRKLMDKTLKSKDSQSMTGDELAVLVEESEREGTLGSNESELIQSAIAFEEITIKDILTPRVDTIMAEDTDSADELYALFQTHHHSRIPLFHETVDNIIGVVHEKDFFPAYLQDRSFPIVQAAKKALFVPDTLRISAMLSRFRREKAHMAVVIDQYGGVQGIVTMEDVLEELVGEIYDESDVVEQPLVQTGEDTWTVDGTVSVDDVLEALGLSYETDDIESTSIGGLATELAGRLPDVGDTFVYRELGLTVTKVADRRVESLEITRLISPEAQDEDEL